MDRPRTTLFLLMSVDGKISTGSSDSLDFDRDLPKIKGVKEGLSQYYDLEKRTDIYSLNSGRVFAKIGLNQKKAFPSFIPVSFVLVDNSHLKASGIKHLVKNCRKLILITSNKKHPALRLEKEIDNLEVLLHTGSIDLKRAFAQLKKMGVKKLTVQSGGTLNSLLLRAGLIDRVSVVVAPVLVGGKDTSTLIDGTSLKKVSELSKIRALELVSAKKLKGSYLHLVYKVRN